MSNEELVIALEERVRVLKVRSGELREKGWFETADVMAVDIYHLENSVRLLQFWNLDEAVG